MKHDLFAFAAALLVSSGAFAQTAIVVNGRGSVEVVLDHSQTDFNHQTPLVSTSAQAVTQATAAVLTIKSRLEELGLKVNTHFHIGDVRAWRKWNENSQTYVGYHGNVAFRVSYPFTLPKADEISDYLVKNMKAREVESILSTEARAKASREARTRSVSDAQEKAQAYAEGVKCTLGRIVAVDETFGSTPPSAAYESSARSSSATRSSIATDTAAAERATSVSMHAKFTFACQ